MILNRVDRDGSIESRMANSPTFGQQQALTGHSGTLGGTLGPASCFQASHPSQIQRETQEVPLALDLAHTSQAELAETEHVLHPAEG